MQKLLQYVTSGAFIAVFVKLLLGAGQYIIQKDTIHSKCSSLNSASEVEFQRPFFFTAGNFLFMLLVVLPLIPGQIRQYRRQQARPKTETDPQQCETYTYSWRVAMYSGFPAALDVLAVLLSMKATEYLQASVVVLLKATRVVFTAGLTSVMLKKRVQMYQWMGVLVTCLALIPIYFESSIHAKMEKDRLEDLYRKNNKQTDPNKVTTSGEVSLGYGLILAAELMRAIRFVYEEWLIKKQHMAAQFLLISECTFGAVLACFACLYLNYYSLDSKVFVKEEFAESWHRFQSSGSLQTLFIIYCLAAGICNIAGTFITKYLSSVINALVSELRVVLVFIPNVIRYAIDKDKADQESRKVKGEPLDGWSMLKIVGFFLLVLGAYIYNGTVKLPCANCQPAATEEKKEMATVDSHESTPRQETRTSVV